MEKGIYTIYNPEYNAFACWNVQNFKFKDEELNNDNNGYAIIFDTEGKAIMYIKANSDMEGAVPYKIDNQNSWENFIIAHTKHNTNEMVLNRCILGKTHDCTIWIFKFTEYNNFDKFEEFIKDLDYCTEGYMDVNNGDEEYNLISDNKFDNPNNVSIISVGEKINDLLDVEDIDGFYNYYCIDELDNKTIEVNDILFIIYNSNDELALSILEKNLSDYKKTTKVTIGILIDDDFNEDKIYNGLGIFDTYFIINNKNIYNEINLIIEGILAPIKKSNHDDESLYNNDLDDLMLLLENGGIANIGKGEGTGENKIQEAISNALNNTLYSLPIKYANSLIIRINGDKYQEPEEIEDTLLIILKELNIDIDETGVSLLFGNTKNYNYNQKEGILEITIIALEYNIEYKPKGFFTIYNKKEKRFIKDVTEIQKNQEEIIEENEKVALVFNDESKALEYIDHNIDKNNDQKYYIPYLIDSQKSYDDFLNTHRLLNTNEMILNRCILLEEHDCPSKIHNFSEFNNYNKLNYYINKQDYCEEEYIEEFYGNKVTKNKNAIIGVGKKGNTYVKQFLRNDYNNYNIYTIEELDDETIDDNEILFIIYDSNDENAINILNKNRLVYIETTKISIGIIIGNNDDIDFNIGFLDTYFKIPKYFIHENIKSIIEAINATYNKSYYNNSQINNNLLNVLKFSGIANMGSAYGLGDDMIESAIEEAYENIILDVPFNKAKSLIIHITGGRDLTMLDINKAIEIIKEKLNDEINIFFSYTIDEDYYKDITVTLLSIGYRDYYAHEKYKKDIEYNLNFLKVAQDNSRLLKIIENNLKGLKVDNINLNILKIIDDNLSLLKTINDNLTGLKATEFRFKIYVAIKNNLILLKTVENNLNALKIIENNLNILKNIDDNFVILKEIEDNLNLIKEL